MPRVIHFEIPADDAGRAQRFYEQVFGWEFNKWEGPSDYWLIKTGGSGPGIDGGMMPRPMPGAGVVNTIDVADLDQSVQSVEQNGGKVAMPRMSVPGIGYLCYCVDTEGNMFGLMQMDPSAK